MISMRALHHRRGFTLIDLLVAISVLGMLLAVSVPAIHSARESARRATCQHHLRQLGLSVHVFAEARAQNLPALHNGLSCGSWARQLLPFLDQTPLSQELDAGYTAITANVDLFTCPSDSNNCGQAGGLSYVANAGFIPASLWDDAAANVDFSAAFDWDQDGDHDASDQRVTRSTGVFWRPGADGFHMTFDRIQQGDGLGQTILLSENLQARQWHSDVTSNIAFGARIPITTTGAPLPRSGLSNLVGSVLHLPNFLVSGPAVINDDLDAEPGTRPRPSSRHRGGVNAVYCDGRTAFLSNSLDAAVYAQLLTPDGCRFGEAVLSGESVP